MKKIPHTSCIVAGAGPVGMLSALLLSSYGCDTVVVEKNRARQKTSRAIGITPPSLEILSRLGLADEFVRSGVKVRNASVYGERFRLGNVTFDSLEGERYPFILSLPQDVTEMILAKKMKHSKRIRHMTGFTVLSAFNEGERVIVKGVTSSGVKMKFSADVLLACDGKESAVRESLRIPYSGASYRETFIMGDFPDSTGWGDAACFFFTSRGSVESFPMSQSRRRFVLRTPHFIREGQSDYLERELEIRTGLDFSRMKKLWESGFGVQHYEAESFGTGRIFLCGDSAHCMSPIGGQGMNTGFADGECAAYLAQGIVKGENDPATAQRIYYRMRRKAFRAARRRASFLMKSGTSGGKFFSPVRNAVVFLLLRTPLIRLLIPVFTMISIPFRNLRKNGIAGAFVK